MQSILLRWNTIFKILSLLFALCEHHLYRKITLFTNLLWHTVGVGDMTTFLYTDGVTNTIYAFQKLFCSGGEKSYDFVFTPEIKHVVSKCTNTKKYKQGFYYLIILLLEWFSTNTKCTITLWSNNDVCFMLSVFHMPCLFLFIFIFFIACMKSELQTFVYYINSTINRKNIVKHAI